VREVIFGLCKDLSKEQEALQKYHRLFDANPALMAVTSAETRCFVEVNQAWLGRLGYLRDEVIGRSPEELELFPGRADQRAVRDQLLSTGRISKIELEVRRKDGELLTGLFTGETIRSQGRTYLLTVMVDITEQKRAEARLLAAKAELERLNAELRVQAEEARQRLDQVKTLRGIIPICCVCKRIRDDEQYWSQVEAYIEQHTDAQFSHSYCPECAAKQFPEE
jgi:PAS domain S-box-containing protein